MAQTKPDQIRASKFIGSTVYDVQNQNIGSVKDLIFDRDGRIEAAVVDVGTFLGMGGKNVAIKLSDIKTANSRLTLDMSKDQLKSAHEFKFPETSSTGASTPPANRPANPWPTR
jgi:sporulation protein YlmC with PRC-barrel domain